MVETPPTREHNTLDLFFTNFHEHIVRAGVTEAICNQDKVETDHLTVYINAKIPRVPAYEIEKYSYTRQTEEGNAKLKVYLEKQNWRDMFRDLEEVDQMVEKLHCVFNNGMAECYEVKESTKKSSEPPWMMKEILKLIKKELFSENMRRGLMSGKSSRE